MTTIPTATLSEADAARVAADDATQDYLEADRAYKAEPTASNLRALTAAGFAAQVARAEAMAYAGTPSHLG